MVSSIPTMFCCLRSISCLFVSRASRISASSSRDFAISPSIRSTLLCLKPSAWRILSTFSSHSETVLKASVSSFRSSSSFRPKSVISSWVRASSASLSASSWRMVSLSLLISWICPSISVLSVLREAALPASSSIRSLAWVMFSLAVFCSMDLR